MPTPGNSVNGSHYVINLKTAYENRKELFRKKKGSSENEREKMEEGVYDQNVFYACMKIC